MCSITQLCPTLCNLMECSPPGFSVHGIFQARILEWVAISFYKGSSWPRVWIWVSCIRNRILYLVVVAVVQLLFKLCLTLRSHGQQHTRLPCPSLSPRVCSNSCPLSWWCHPTISSPIAPVSSCPQSFPASGSFPMSCLFTSGGQSIGASTRTVAY